MGLDEEISLRAWLLNRCTCNEQSAIQTLVKAGFPVLEQDKKVSVLSGGEKSRLNFVLFKMNQNNLFLLDEPTNHLDFQGREDLERELCVESASLLFTSHDRRFVENVATRVFIIENNQLLEK
jgi:ATPase subunit of ABC transporter with duplicated ATPase domains